MSNSRWSWAGWVILSSCAPAPLEESVGTTTEELGQGDAGGATEDGDAFGAVLAAGDFNADGFDDLVVGAPGEDSSAGAIFLFMGSSAGITTGTFIKQSNTGGTNVAGDEFGAAIASGNLNGDAYDDLVVGIPGKENDAGRVAVWLGSASGIDRASGRFFAANQLGCGAKEANDEFGAALAIGDFNADGFGDLAIGAPGENSDAGWVCIVKGRTGDGVGSNTGAYYSQSTTSGTGNEEAGDRFGASLAAGKLTDGAHHDLLVGAPGENTSKGAAMVLFGTGSASTAASGFFTSGTVLWENDAGDSDASGQGFGSVVAAANVDGDAYDDVLIGAPNEVVTGTSAGAAYVFPGKSGGPSSGIWYDQIAVPGGAGNESGDRFGAALVAADFDRDGRVDVAVGSPGEGFGALPATSGAVGLFPATVAGLEVGRTLTQEDVSGGSEVADFFGSALAVGDFDGDTYPDLAIGSPGEAPGSSPAGGYVSIREGAPTVELSVGPVVGATTANSARIWVRANRAASYQVAYKPVGGGPEQTVSFGTLSSSQDYTGTVVLTGLSSATEYDYRVLLANQQHFSGRFRTFPAANAAGQIVFTYGADLNLRYRPYRAASEVLADAPHFMLLGGDNMYADSFLAIPDTKAAYEGRYRQTLGDPALRALMQRIPTFMMWDDHEIWNDWYPGKDARYPNARAAFDEYQGAHNPAPVATGALYYTFTAGQSAFFVLDTRSHRSPNGAADGPTKTMLGSAQKAALLGWLDSVSAKFKFVVSSVPFSTYGTTGNDSWEGFLDERNQILSHIGDNAIPGVVLVSGDQHWAGVFRIDDVAPYGFYEFMATPMGTNNRAAPVSNCNGTPQSPCSNSELLYVNDDHRGYGRFTIDTSVSPATLTFEWVEFDGSVLHSLVLDETDVIP